MNFINIQVFWYVPLILVFMVLLFWRARVRRTNIMRMVLGPRATDGEHVQLSLARRLFRFCLLLLTMLMLVAAIARPTWKLKLVPYQTRGRDLMVLFDVSKSMLAQDIKPSRLTHAKLFLRDLVEQSGSDRFGLVAFAGRAFLECPMTTDKTSFTQYIDELDTSSIPLGGTNLQLALETAMKAFDAAEGNNKAIILITDGDELTGNSKLALSKLKEAKIPLLIVGVGSSASPALIPLQSDDGNMKFMRDSKGELVKTRLNVALMQQLADATNGCFVHSTTTDFGLDEIEVGIKKLLPEELEKGEKTRPIERFYYFLAFATALLWLWMLVSEHPGKKHRKNAITSAAVIVGMFFLGQNSIIAQETQEKLPENILPETAQNAKKSKAEAEPEPVDPVAAYNKAREIQVSKKGDPSELYATAINLADKNLPVRSKSFNNLGVVKHQQARKQVAQGIAQVRQQKLDGAISQLENAKKILDRAEEMYIKALSSEASTPPPKPEYKETEKTKQNIPEKSLSQSAVNQQLLLNDRVMIDELIKKIKELKKQQKKAQKQTRKAQKQQQKKNQQKQKQQQNKQQNKQQQKKDQQKQNKQQNKQQQKKDQQNKPQQQKDQQKKNKQQNKQQQKKDQQKQNKQQNKQQQKKSEDELKKAQNEVKKLQKQAKDLGQKKLENKARKAKEELDKAEKSRKENKGRKTEEHIKKALKELKPQGGKNKQNKKDQKKQGKGQKKPQDKKKQNKGKDQNKDKNKNKGDKKLPKPQQAQAAKAKKAPKPKDLKPEDARKLLKLMNEKEKDFRKALKASQKEQYKNIKVEKDW